MLAHPGQLDLFWTLTPREVLILLEAYRVRAIRDRNERVFAAYSQAAFTRAKKMPRIDRIFEDDTTKPKPRGRQSPQEQIAMLRGMLEARKKR